MQKAATVRTPIAVKYPGSGSSKAFQRVAGELAGLPVEEEPKKVQ
ncbi:hypothetical protein [Methanoculleus thermophilus]|nr:hypothetical protein [Methanoculleus thermophilus]